MPLEEFEFPSKKISNIQSQLEKLIGQNYYLNKASQKIFFPILAYLTLLLVRQRWVQILHPGIRVPQLKVGL